MAELSAVSEWANGLLTRISPAARSALARQIALQLRQSQQQRISQQMNPDGSGFAPRKPQQHRVRGRVRSKMFQKLKAARFLRMRSNANAAIIEFTGTASRIATVHQLGLRDRVSNKSSVQAQYPVRELLGLTAADQTRISDLVMRHLSNRL